LKVICWANLKGGTGKSMLCYNMAGIISEKTSRLFSKDEKGKRILVVDADPQGNVTNNFGINRLVSGIPTIVNVFEDNFKAEKVIMKTQTPNVSIIAGDLNFTHTELIINTMAGRELIFQRWLEDNYNYLESNFDYIFIDSPPSFNIICQNFYIVSNHIILVNDVSMNSIEGSEQFCALWRAIRLQLRLSDNISAFLINNSDKRIGLTKDFYEHVHNHPEIKYLVLDSIIPNDVRMKDSELLSKTINYVDRKCRAYISCKHLEEELYTKEIL
jgi:chromosome partitioning protein